MKKIILSLATVLAVSAFIFAGCNKELPSNKSTVPEAKVCNPFDFVGELHNQGLNAIYEGLSATKASDISEDAVQKLAEAFCNDVYSKDERFLISPLTKSGDFGLNGTEEDASISEEVSNYMDKIVAVASTEDYDYIKEQFSTFEEDIILNKANIFTNYETDILLCTLALGKYSNEYWKDYNISTKSWKGELVGADVGGALIGIKADALFIAINFAFGPGAGLAATAKTVLLSGLEASAIAGIAIGVGQLF